MTPHDRRALSDCLARLADGDRGAFDAVFRLAYPELRAFAARHLPPADADDTAQQALVALFARVDEYDAARDGLAWALGIAAWEVRTCRRRATRRREDGALPDLAAATPTPEHQAIDAELRASLAAAVGALRRRARLVYERRRLRQAVLATWPVAPITALAATCCGPLAPTLLAAGALAALVAGCRFFGRTAGRAVTPGLLAGLPLLGLTLTAPTLARLLGDSCSSACRLLGAVCLLGGLVTGGLLSVAAPRGVSLPAALAIAGLTGSVGCAMLGVAGVTGIAFGLAVAAGLSWGARLRAES